MSALPTECNDGVAVLLADDEAAAYQALLARALKHFAPIGDDELAVVQSIAGTDWRLLRIPALETGIYAVGRLEFAALFSSVENAAARRRLIDAKVFLTYQRQLSNLAVQEARLRRQREKDVQVLRDLQEARQRERSARLDQAANAYIEAVYEDRQDEWDDPRVLGFDFSLGEIELRAMDLDRNLFADYEKELAEKWKQRRGTAAPAPVLATIPKPSLERERPGSSNRERERAGV